MILDGYFQPIFFAIVVKSAPTLCCPPLFLSNDEYEIQTKEIARKKREEKLEKERREKEWAEAAKRRKEQERLRKEPD